MQDAQGHAVTLGSEAARAAHAATIESYLGCRVDAAAKLKATLALGDAPLPLVLKGAFAMMTFTAAAVPSARASAERALAAGGTPREQAHAAALAAWAGGEPERALAAWEAIGAEHPRDILAFRLHHFLAFWMGRAVAMARFADAIAPHWDAGVPGFASTLGCRAFACEEVGRYAEAEALGREAVEREPTDAWAAHAVAHVLEMQGRRGEGIAWIAGLQANWGESNNIRHHLFWHRALFHIERGEHDWALRLYDEGFRDLAAPLTQAMPDLYIDIQNAASALFRLERLGVAVGDRWGELADHAQARIGDTQSAFTLPHWMMALCATQRWDAAKRMLDAIEQAANGSGLPALILRRSALPACRAVWLRARGDHAAALEAMAPALGSMAELGGSHAQQDVLEQLFLDVALRAAREDAARTLLERVAARRPVPPGRRAGYAEAARAIAH